MKQHILSICAFGSALIGLILTDHIYRRAANPICPQTFFLLLASCIGFVAVIYNKTDSRLPTIIFAFSLVLLALNFIAPMLPE